MSNAHLLDRVRELSLERLPPPGGGSTPSRFERLMEVGAEDLSLAKLVEAHWDAVAILHEAGREPESGAVYAVWASEIPGHAMCLTPCGADLVLNGCKPFCSGLGLVDRALLTVTEHEAQMLDVDMRAQAEHISMDNSAWATEAFRETRTGAVAFNNYITTRDAVVGPPNFYLSRPGFWHGACGPAACWVGGASALVEYAKSSRRADPHTLAHVGAMDAAVWMMKAALHQAGRDIDSCSATAAHPATALIRALRLRHIVEQGCTDILRRFTRAYGPHPLAMNAETSRRYLELDLYLRQSHAERDLEQLGRALIQQSDLGENPLNKSP